MINFNDLTTRNKLALSFGGLLAILALVIALAWSALTRVQSAQRDFYEGDFVLSQKLVALQINLNNVRVKGLFLLLVAGDKQREQALIAQIRSIADSNSALLLGLEPLVARNPALQSHYGRLRATLEEFQTVRDDRVLPLVLSGKLDEAKALSLGEQAERFVTIDRTVGLMVDSAEHHAAGTLEASRRLTDRSFLLFWMAAAGAAAFALWIILLLNRSLAGPLNALTQQAARIAEGDLGLESSGRDRKDELGKLSSAFERMAGSLRTTAGMAETIADGDLTRPMRPRGPKDQLGISFERMAGSLRKVVREISGEINVLVSSTAQISAGSSELVATASQTATAINETTTTVEEVRQTAQVASQKAKAVASTAEKAAHVSQAGKKAVEDSIQAMVRIRDQMESIAGSTVRLGEQNQAIGDIIASVNELAEQANLLSVNAALEAARAGEHGRGFLVVAQEMRSLADQSKAATRQVRGILNEIQKGIAKAVMSAEQGAKSVEGGVRQTEEAAQAIAVLAETVQESAQAAMQIAASSHQQLVGMDQVTSAMESIRQAGNQNVASVNQANTASRNLNELGQRLKALVDQYKV